MTFDFDAAIDEIVQALRPWTLVNWATSRPQGPQGCELWLPDVTSRVIGIHWASADREVWAPVLEILCDAAAELVRIGVLRPGRVLPEGASIVSWSGEGFSLTASGRNWVQNRPSGPPRDPGKFMQALTPFEKRFGPGFIQRATEAVGCWRTGHYLAACVMCGGASESILLATAIEKNRGDEAAVLKEYRTSSGRKNLVKRLAQGTKTGVLDQLETFVRLLGFWRDEAGHGLATAITEAEANLAALQLLRFAQFVDVHWNELTK